MLKDRIIPLVSHFDLTRVQWTPKAGMQVDELLYELQHFKTAAKLMRETNYGWQDTIDHWDDSCRSYSRNT